MGMALVQAKTVEENDYHVVFTVQLLVGIAIYAFFYVTAPWLAVWFKSPIYTELLRVSALSFILRPFANVPGALLNREMRFKSGAVVGLAILIFSSMVSITLAFLGMGVWSLILGGMAGSLVNIVAVSVIARWRPAIRFNRAVLRRLGAYGLKSAGNEFVLYLRYQTANFITSRALGPAMVGLYNKADSLSEMPVQTISGAVHRPVFRALSKVQDDQNQAKYIYFRALMLVTVYTVPFYLALWWLADPFIKVVYGTKWVGMIEPLEILALSGLFRCIINQSGAATEALNQLGREFQITVESFVFVVIACLIGVKWGVVGLAWAMNASHVYTFIRMYSLASKCVNGTYRDLLRALIPMAVLNIFLLGVFVAGHYLFFRGFAGEQPVLYLLGMSLLGGAAYAVAFLYFPIQQLSSEVTRWKQRFGWVKSES